LAAGEGVEPSFLRSERSVLPITPSHKRALPIADYVFDLWSLTDFQIGNRQSAMYWLREKDSNLHLRIQSPTCCRLHYPGKNCLSFLCFDLWFFTLVGTLGFEPRTLRLSGANTAYKAAALPIELCPEKKRRFVLSTLLFETQWTTFSSADNRN
jgi:hypothetical protein